jgi:hypothetical protein
VVRLGCTLIVSWPERSLGEECLPQSVEARAKPTCDRYNFGNSVIVPLRRGRRGAAWRCAADPKGTDTAASEHPRSARSAAGRRCPPVTGTGFRIVVTSTGTRAATRGHFRRCGYLSAAPHHQVINPGRRGSYEPAFPVQRSHAVGLNTRARARRWAWRLTSSSESAPNDTLVSQKPAWDRFPL